MVESILDNCHKLLNKYTLWFHNPNDTNWQIDSYHKIITFTTIEEFWTITNYLKSLYCLIKKVV